VKAAGGVAAVVNLRHAIAKEQGWAERPPSTAEFVRAALEDPNLLRRPIFIRGNTVLVGFDKSNRERWAKLA
jgi:arsenate reductase-like glutaredoxin family protein